MSGDDVWWHDSDPYPGPDVHEVDWAALGKAAQTAIVRLGAAMDVILDAFQKTEFKQAKTHMYVSLGEPPKPKMCSHEDELLCPHDDKPVRPMQRKYPGIPANGTFKRRGL